jgi:hypothetical protein
MTKYYYNEDFNILICVLKEDIFYIEEVEKHTHIIPLVLKGEKTSYSFENIEAECLYSNIKKNLDSLVETSILLESKERFNNQVSKNLCIANVFAMAQISVMIEEELELNYNIN